MALLPLLGAQPFDGAAPTEMAQTARRYEAALRLRLRADHESQPGILRTAVLDQLQTGIMVTDAQGMVRYANRSAAILAERGGISFGTQSAFLAGRPEDIGAILRLVQAACAGLEGGRLYLPGPHNGTNPGRPLAVTVAPLKLPQADAVFSTEQAGSGYALITLGANFGQPDFRRVTEMFHMTPGETRLLPPIMAGETTTSIARALGLSHHTVRSHVRAILSKTHTHTLRALAVLLKDMATT